VHLLWSNRARKFFCGDRIPKSARAALCTPFRASLRLIAGNARVKCVRLPGHNASCRTVTNAVHRFAQSIAGRDYLIEVKAVSEDRWRAYIVRRPGLPNALMPFYGPTPAEAAKLLGDWLTRAHRRAANPAGTV
jgi:hypothetical protein